jgi:hypothetical protein
MPGEAEVDNRIYKVVLNMKSNTPFGPLIAAILWDGEMTARRE